MTDLFTHAEQDYTQITPPVLSVSQISTLLKQNVEETFSLVAVVGEITSLSKPASGHVYFMLKDDKSVLKSVIWKGLAGKLAHSLQNGAKIIAHGKLTTYAGRSDYQIIINHIEQAGLGLLMQQLEELKQKLTAEGLFAEETKQKIPLLPTRIGIITSATGAVIDDILHRIKARCPRNVSLWPVLVQGEGSATQITQAIQGFNNLKTNKPDVIIIARGGGSFEDLMPFNSEILVREIADSQIPIISGVGHEPDFTLCDMAADVRAPTPTAAAEIAVPVREDYLYALTNIQTNLGRNLTQKVTIHRQNLHLLQKGLPNLSSIITQEKLQLEDKAERINLSMQNHLKTQSKNLNHMVEILNSLAPMAPLKRGFIYATAANGQPINTAKTTEKTATLHFHDGQRKAELK